jgi:DNA-binding response OmpR family regulator
MPKMLIIDDEPDILESTKWAFEVAGFEVHTAASGKEALPQNQEVRPEVLLIDYKLPDMTGLEILRAVKALDPNSVAIMITGLTHESEEIELMSKESGAAGILHKPLKIQDVIRIVKEKLRPSTGSGRTEGD